MKRRQSLALISAASATAFVSRSAAENFKDGLISTNTYPWLTFAKRAGDKFSSHTGEPLLRKIASTGIGAVEPILDKLSDLEGLKQTLERCQLQMPSIYVNSVLHDESKIDQSSAKVLEIAQAAKKLGTSIVVTNPSPIRWGGPEDKSDAQLRTQAKALDQLGEELRKVGLTLAYHNHDAELRQGAREFHHMLTTTHPENVKFCLDAHWIFRGCGNSEVAVFDALAHYKDRIVELHLRQSNEGTWQEAFSPKGDIDYPRLIKLLAAEKIRPHLALEQAVEAESSKHLSAVEAHRRGLTNLRKELK